MQIILDIWALVLLLCEGIAVVTNLEALSPAAVSQIIIIKLKASSVSS
jgi:hypothetical protein